ncbi:hypothetical protein ACHJH3_01870 [Campylobacter sp. MOP7]|uniref:hypothetical protein n=1 Tax=Campylobacter canis TaxID=3378588 RepID=UPI00387EA79C
MQVILKNVDSSFLPILESFKSIMPNLQIEKIKEWDDKRTPEQISLELETAVNDYKSGDISKFQGFDEAKKHGENTLKRLGADV